MYGSRQAFRGFSLNACQPRKGSMNSNLSDRESVRIICSENSWIEGDAVRQLQQASALDGIAYSVGLPDIHPGKYGPVGAAHMSNGIIYPALIGNDVGCGVGLFSTSIKKKKISGRCPTEPGENGAEAVAKKS